MSPDHEHAEPDEDPGEVLAAFERGEKGFTGQDAEQAFDELVRLGQEVELATEEEGT